MNLADRAFVGVKGVAVGVQLSRAGRCKDGKVGGMQVKDGFELLHKSCLDKSKQPSVLASVSLPTTTSSSSSPSSCQPPTLLPCPPSAGTPFFIFFAPLNPCVFRCISRLVAGLAAAKYTLEE
jgi:hypothetical protein